MSPRDTRCSLALFTFAALLLIDQPLRAQVYPDSDWEKADPRSQCVGPNHLQRALGSIQRFSGTDGISQVVVVRNGYLIWKGSEANIDHRIWSGTKGFTSGLVLGLMVGDGSVGIADAIHEHLPYLQEYYDDARLFHFATMTSGYNAVGGNQSWTWWERVQPMFAPGSRFLYWDAAYNELSYALTKARDGPLDVLLQKRIMKPLQAIDWSWGSVRVDRGGTEVNGGSGNQKGGGGISISSLEWARVGHLLVNDGEWEGKQLLSEKWIERRMSSAQVPASTPTADEKSGEIGPGVYGFGTWTNGVQPDSTRLWPDAPPSTFAFAGHNNNHLFVVPEWNLVLVREGTDGSVDIEKYNAFFRALRGGIRACQ